MQGKARQQQLSVGPDRTAEGMAIGFGCVCCCCLLFVVVVCPNFFAKKFFLWELGHNEFIATRYNHEHTPLIRKQ